MSTIEDMRKKHPNALCFQGSDCACLEPEFFEQGGPCRHWPSKFPQTFCRMGFALDKRIKPELKE